MNHVFYTIDPFTGALHIIFGGPWICGPWSQTRAHGQQPPGAPGRCRLDPEPAFGKAGALYKRSSHYV